MRPTKKILSLILAVITVMTTVLGPNKYAGFEVHAETVSSDADFEIEGTVLKKYTGTAERVIIPDGITEIGAAAFYSNDYMRYLEIPDSVTIIRNQAFRYCEQLAEIKMPEHLDTIEYSAFEGVRALKYIIIPDGVDEIPQMAIANNYWLKYIVIPDGVKTIGSEAFAGNIDLETVVIPKSVESISSDALMDSYDGDKRNILVGDEDNEAVQKLADESRFELVDIDVAKKLTIIEDGASVTVKDRKGNILGNNATVKTGDIIFISAKTDSDEDSLLVNVNGEPLNYPMREKPDEYTMNYNHDMTKFDGIPYVVVDDVEIEGLGNHIGSIQEALNAKGENRVYDTNNVKLIMCDGYPAVGFNGRTSKISIEVESENPIYLSFDIISEGSGITLTIDDTSKALKGERYYTQIAYEVPAGKHTISWSVKSSSSTKIDAIRNIRIADTPGDVKLTYFAIDESIVDLRVGQEDSVVYTIYPVFMSGTDVEVSCSDDSVVEITDVSEGKITLKGLKRGKAVLKCKCKGRVAKVNVFVTTYEKHPGYDYDDASRAANTFYTDEPIITDEERVPTLDSSYREINIKEDTRYSYFVNYNGLYRYYVEKNEFSTSPIYIADGAIKNIAKRGPVIYMYTNVDSSHIRITGYDVFLDEVVYQQDFLKKYTDSDYGFAVDDEQNFYFSKGLDLFICDKDGNLLDKKISSDSQLIGFVGDYYITDVSADGKLLCMRYANVENSVYNNISKEFLGGQGTLSIYGCDSVFGFRPIRNGKFAGGDFIISGSYKGYSNWNYFDDAKWAITATGVLCEYKDTKYTAAGVLYMSTYLFAGRDTTAKTLCPAAYRDGIIYSVSNDSQITMFDINAKKVVGTASVDGSIQGLYTTDNGLYARYKRDNLQYITPVQDIEYTGTIYRKDHITLTYTKDEVIENYKAAQNTVNYKLSENVFSDEPSSVSPYSGGELSDSAVNDTQKLINYARWQYGVNTVTLNTDKMGTSQKGAVLMAATGTMSHSPSKPADMSDSFYSEAKEGLGAGSGYSGNISYGETLDDAVFGYVNDLNNVSSGLGHRLSILGTKNIHTSFGYCKGYTAFTMYESVNPAELGNDEEFYAWPSAGYFPSEAIDPNSEWHIITDWYENVKVHVELEYDGETYTAPITSYDKNVFAFGFKLPDELKAKLLANGESSIFIDGAVVNVSLVGLKDKKGNDIVVTYPVRFVQTEPVMLKHNYDTGVVTKEPTCTEDGLKVYTCSTCGDTKEEVLEAPGHTEVKTDAVDPTCTEPGHTEGITCSVCKAVIKAEEEIPALGHDKVTEDAKDPTCTEDGYSEYSYCRRCNVVLKERTTTPATGHKYDDGEVILEATETTAGAMRYTCTVCSETKDVEIPPTGNIGEVTFTGLEYLPEEMNIGDSFYLNPTFDRVLTEDDSFEWKVLTPDVISIDEDGKLTALEKGAARFTYVLNGVENEEGFFITVLEPQVDFWPFNDVKPTDALADEVRFAYDQGIISGYGDPDENGQVAFKPANKVRRVQFAIMIYNMAGKPAFDKSKAGSFTDMNEGDSGYEAVLWASSNHIINGFEDGSFKPTKTISRSQIAIMLFNYARMKGYISNDEIAGLDDSYLDDFADGVEIKKGARLALAWAVEENLISGNSKNRVVPNGDAQRNQCAAIFARFYKRYVN